VYTLSTDRPTTNDAVGGGIRSNLQGRRGPAAHPASWQDSVGTGRARRLAFTGRRREAAENTRPPEAFEIRPSPTDACREFGVQTKPPATKPPRAAKLSSKSITFVLL